MQDGTHIACSHSHAMYRKSGTMGKRSRRPETNVCHRQIIIEMGVFDFSAFYFRNDSGDVGLVGKDKGSQGCGKGKWDAGWWSGG